MIPKEMKSEAKKGKITYNKEWNLSEKHHIALMRLSELGVDVHSSIGSTDFVFNIPHKLRPPIYVEVGFLIAQFCDDNFSVGYADICDVDSSGVCQCGLTLASAVSRRIETVSLFCFRVASSPETVFSRAVLCSSKTSKLKFAVSISFAFKASAISSWMTDNSSYTNARYSLPSMLVRESKAFSTSGPEISRSLKIRLRGPLFPASFSDSFW